MAKAKTRKKGKKNKLDFKPGKVLEEFDVEDEKGKIGRKGRKLHVVLRYPKLSDVDQALKFINSAITETEFLRQNKKMTRKEEAEWLKGTIKGLREGRKLFTFIEIDGVISGSSAVNRSYGAQHHVGEIGIALREKFTNIGIGTRTMEFMLNESIKMGIEVMRISHYENNKRARHVYEKLGFRHIGVVPKAMKKLDGTYQNQAIMYKIMV